MSKTKSQVTPHVMAETLRLARQDVATNEQGIMGMYARALVSLEEQFDALKVAATRQLTPLDVAATHIDILRRNSESYDAQGRDNVALIVENNVNEARKALFDAISNPASSPLKCPRCGSTDFGVKTPGDTWLTCNVCGYEFVDKDDVPEPDPATKPERDCECDRRGLSKDDECIYELPCTDTEPGRDLNPAKSLENEA